MAYKYNIYDSNDKLIGPAFSDDAPESPVWRLIFSQADLEKAKKHEFVRILIPDKKIEPIDGRIMSINGSVVTVKGVRVRENLRMPVRFESHIYPVSGNWKGRMPIVSNDLSCGGFAFACDRKLDIDEVVQTIIPITSNPILLNVKVLRTRIVDSKTMLYAAEFCDMLHEEEMLVRETVFKLQLKYVPED